jgi:hypothetical protein
MSHKHQPTQAVGIFHRVVHSLVLKTVGVMFLVRRAFKAFDDLDQDLAQFIRSRVFYRCDQFLVPWPRSIEPKLSDSLTRYSKTSILQGCWVPSPSEYSDFSQIVTSYVLFSCAEHGLTTPACENMRSEILKAHRVRRPSQSISD